MSDIKADLPQTIRFAQGHRGRVFSGNLMTGYPWDGWVSFLPTRPRRRPRIYGTLLDGDANLQPWRLHELTALGGGK